jgi:hypothetical protein
VTRDPAQPDPASPALPEIPVWLCLSLLAGLVLAVLGGVLFVNTNAVLSDGQMDLSTFFIYWRYFGFNELKAGHLALWNPHYFCGAPFFGNFQSALLYPVNFLFMILPLAAAVNWSIAINVWLGGVFMFYWARYRRLHSLACLLAAAMFMFCGPHFLQIRAGHLPNLCTLIWAPLLFLAIDQVLDNPSPAPALLGMFALAMAIFAGHPQYVFYMGVAAGIYTLLNLSRAPRRARSLAWLAALVAGGTALAAIQLLTGIQESRESMRAVGLPFEFASTYSFPPENLLTLVAPWCFGDANHSVYCGRWFVTEVSLFASVAGLALAVCGMGRAARPTRPFAVTMVVITLVLALGRYTPLFRLLYNAVPGFNSFRGMDKFIWLTAMFLSLLAGIGFDGWLRRRETPRGVAVGCAAAGIVLLCLAALARNPDVWSRVLNAIPASETPFLSATDRGPGFAADTGAQMVRSLWHAALALFGVGVVFALGRVCRKLACAGALAFALVELTLFAHASVMTFHIGAPYPGEILDFLAAHPGDYRIQSENPNRAMGAGVFDVGGDDPSGLLRYARFYNACKGGNDDSDLFGLPRKVREPAALRMVRLRYFISESRLIYIPVTNDLPHLAVIDRYRVVTNRHEILSTLATGEFPVDREVILETRPTPEPVAAREKGTAKLLDAGSDYLTVEAEMPSPALLLVTDAYSSGWRARALPGSAQDRYEIMPANYCLRAVPLGAGHHRLRLEYSPSGFRVGRIISVAAWALFAAACGLALAQKSQWSRKLATETGPRAAL